MKHLDLMPKGIDKWTSFIKEELDELQPDIAVIDFMTWSGHNAVKDLKIPTVLNLPGPVNVLNFMCEAKLPNKNNTCACCGFLCVKQTLIEFFIHKIFTPFVLSRATNRARREVPSHIVICHSFWGLEKPSPIPPNIVMTGPLMRESTNLMERLQEKDPKLLAWLNEAQA